MTVVVSSLASSTMASDTSSLDGIHLPIAYQVNKTCRYFENIAYVDRVHGDGEYSPYIATARNCISARDIRRTTPNGSDAQNLASDYLQSLVAFRNHLIAINSQKFWRARRGESFVGSVGKLNKSSFYLIARSHDVFNKHAELTRAFQLASAKANANVSDQLQ